MKAERAAAIFHVSNLESACDFYVDVLGFAEDFRYGDYAGLKHGSALLHLSAGDRSSASIGKGNLYVFCDEVDDYYQAVVSRGAKALGEPEDMPFGLRDFQVTDLDGNHIGFGCDLAPD